MMRNTTPAAWVVALAFGVAIVLEAQGGPERDIQVPARPVAGGARGDDVAVAVGGARWGCCQIPVEDRELDETVEDPQRLVMGDVLLCLRRQDVGQQEMGRGVGHGMAFRTRA